MRFVEFEFHQCYYSDLSFYSAESIESRFNGGIMQYQPLIGDPRRGTVLTIEQDMSNKKPSDPIKYVLLQVFQIMPIKVVGITMNQGLILHELVMKVWTCRSDDYLGSFAKGQYHLSPLKTLNLYMLLDKEVCHSILHLYKKGHLALLANLKLLEQLTTMSEQLQARVMTFIDWDYTVHIGLTLQQAHQNSNDNYKAQCICTCVFQEVDFCFISLGSEITNPALANVEIAFTDDVNSVFLKHEQEIIEEQ